MLFDEPMSNLDAQLRDQMRIELKVLQDRLGFTAIYVTHDQAEAFALAENVVLMNRGRIETTGAPREVSHRPPTPFVARFLGLNVLGGKATRTGDWAAGPCYAEVALSDALTLRGLVGDMTPMPAGTPVLACVRKEHVTIRKLPPGGRAGLRRADRRGPRRVVPRASRRSTWWIVDGVELRAIQTPIGVPGRRHGRSHDPAGELHGVRGG